MKIASKKNVGMTDLKERLKTGSWGLEQLCKIITIKAKAKKAVVRANDRAKSVGLKKGRVQTADTENPGEMKP